MSVELFWARPELVEKILPYLDLVSILSLVKAHDVTQAFLQRSLNWGKLVRRHCPFHDPYLDRFEGSFSEERVEKKVKLVRGLVAILKVMTNYPTLLPDLLNTVCEQFSDRATTNNHPNEPENFPVSVSCTSYPDGQSVSLLGFVLIEEVESAFGTSLQRLVSISPPDLENPNRSSRTLTLRGPLLSALASRMKRTENVDIRLNFGRVDIEEVKDAHNLSTLILQAASQFDQVLGLKVSGAGDYFGKGVHWDLFGHDEVWEGGETLGKDGWKVLAEALKQKPNMVRMLETSKREMEEADKEDVKTIWESVGEGGFEFNVALPRSGNYEQVQKEDEGAWERVEQILNMTERNWVEHFYDKWGMEYSSD